MAELERDSGDGGLIAVAAGGSVVLPFNYSGMYRGTIGPNGTARTAIYGGEPTAA